MKVNRLLSERRACAVVIADVIGEPLVPISVVASNVQYRGSLTRELCVSVTGAANSWLSAVMRAYRPNMATMGRDDNRTEIVRLEGQIDDLEATIESCRKFVLPGGSPRRAVA